MARRHLAAILCVPIVCAMAWLAHVEGRSYRRTLLKTRPADLMARLIAPAGSRPPAPPSLAASVPPPPAPVLPDPAPEPNPDDNLPTPRPATVPAPPQPQPAASIASPSPPSPKPKPSPSAAPSPSSPRFNPPRNLLAMSREEEERVARALDRYILSKNRTIEDPRLRRRLFDAARPLREARQRTEIAEYQYRILDSDKIGAFSQFGGFVYINRGVFVLAANDVELQFVLAREFAHIDAKDCAKRLAPADSSADPADPDPLARFYRLLATGLPEEEEYQADARAYHQLIRLGYSPHQSLGFMRRYLGYVEQRRSLGEPDPAEENRDDPDSQLRDHWRTLPPAVDRLEKLRAIRGP